MAGICLCRNEECPHKNSCLRFITKEDTMSSFAEFKHICTEENNFTYFWKMDEVAIVSKTEETGD
jgi:hypothetical protein